ncbi:unnamed protein product [Mytilus coruscus]|uniref:Uncharacterized protein n=1 Tax=Mytilus coruscus TaxID=42192 RepID=A0A6J8AD22_MYTCO|nr:unnamed protein product [Mytilus coruscus]
MEGMTIGKHESLKFYIYLCQKIGSLEVVRMRRLAFVIYDIGQTYNTITSGSKGEGLDLKGSDMDVMFIDRYFKVYESETEVVLEGQRFNTIKKEKIITLLTNFYGQGINCFASSETLQDYQNQSNESTESLISRNGRFLQQIMPTLYTIRTMSRTDRVLRLLYNFLHSSRTGISRVLFSLQISETSLRVPDETQYPNSSGNKHHYFSYKQDLSHLVIGLHLDAVSGLLKLASFFYVHKNYIASLTIITYALQKCTDEKIDISFFHFTKTFNPMQKHVLNLMKKEKFHTIMKSLIIHPCRFEKDSSTIPQELQHDVNYFHPLPFAHFLNFLCYYHLYDLSSCRQSLHRLQQAKKTLTKCETILLFPDCLNTVIMCGICYQLMGETNLAVRSFREAAKMDTFNTTSAASRLSSLTS